MPPAAVQVRARSAGATLFAVMATKGRKKKEDSPWLWALALGGGAVGIALLAKLLESKKHPCPVCRAQVAVGTRVCPNCRTPLRWEF